MAGAAGRPVHKRASKFLEGLIAALCEAVRAAVTKRPVNVPEEVEYLWNWYKEVHGHDDLTHLEIAAWAANTGVRIRPWEALALIRIDRERWAAIARKPRPARGVGKLTAMNDTAGIKAIFAGLGKRQPAAKQRRRK